jgi:sugar phosphate isomerase/epimerase
MSTPPGHHHGIRRTIATVCLSGMLQDKLDAAARAGFDGIEIFENDLLASSETPAGVTQSSTHRLRGRWAHDPRWRPASQARCPRDDLEQE